jgi:hypothetical protein
MYCETWCYGSERVDCDNDPSTDCMPPPCEGVCRPEYDNPCEFVECRAGEHCEVQYVECFAYPCEPIAVCVPDERTCQSDLDCDAGFVCSQEICPAIACTPDACAPCFGVCVPVDPTYCYDDSECPPDQICQFDASTRPACDPTGTDCAPDELWFAPGVCVPKPLVCTSDRECAFGYCVNGVCEARFDCDQSHAFCDMMPPACEADLVPSVIDGCFGPCVAPEFCLPASIECLENADCPAGHACEMYCTGACQPGTACSDMPICNGVCVPVAPACRSDADCVTPVGGIGWCFDGLCVFEGNTCLEDSECPGGAVCDLSWCNGGSPMPPCDPSVPDCHDDFIVPCTGVCVPAPTDCVRTGCSGEICADSDMFSTCIWLDEYSCFRDATCERQADGQCGWTQTDELRHCLSQP